MLILISCLSGLGCSGCSGHGGTAAATVFIEGDAIVKKASFTLEELQSMEEGLVEADYFCLNSYGTEQYFHFKGIWLGYILREKVILKDHASRIALIADDDYRVEYALADVFREDYIDENNPEAKHKMILAWEEDGREYDLRKGNPFRLVVGQRKPGDVNKPYWVNYVRTIRVD